jgi:hypothetical protein
MLYDECIFGVRAPKSRERTVISGWNFGESGLFARGTLFTLDAHDAGDLGAIQGWATTGATAAMSLRDPRLSHDKSALREGASFETRRRPSCGILSLGGLAKRMPSVS